MEEKPLRGFYFAQLEALRRAGPGRDRHLLLPPLSPAALVARPSGAGKGDVPEQNSGPSTLKILEPWSPLPVPTCSKSWGGVEGVRQVGVCRVQSRRPEEPTRLLWAQGHEGPTFAGDSMRTEMGSIHRST